MQVSKLLLVVALVCVVLVSGGADMSAGAAGPAAVRQALLRASVRPTGPAAAFGGTFVEGGCCYPLMIKCCYSPPADDAAFPPALGHGGSP